MCFSSPTHKDIFAIPTFNAHHTTEKNPIYNPNALSFSLSSASSYGWCPILYPADALIAERRWWRRRRKKFNLASAREINLGELRWLPLRDHSSSFVQHTESFLFALTLNYGEREGKDQTLTHVRPQRMTPRLSIDASQSDQKLQRRPHHFFLESIQYLKR